MKDGPGFLTPSSFLPPILTPNFLNGSKKLLAYFIPPKETFYTEYRGSAKYIPRHLQCKKTVNPLQICGGYKNIKTPYLSVLEK